MAVFALANDARMSAGFGGEFRYNPIEAIWQSLYRSVQNIYSWTTLVVVLGVILTIPFVYKVVKEINFDFRLPVVFTIVTFGVYASQAVATMYTNGNKRIVRKQR